MQAEVEAYIRSLIEQLELYNKSNILQWNNILYNKIKLKILRDCLQVIKETPIKID